LVTSPISFGLSPLRNGGASRRSRLGSASWVARNEMVEGERLFDELFRSHHPSMFGQRRVLTAICTDS
jgi:hypothetical protein